VELQQARNSGAVSYWPKAPPILLDYKMTPARVDSTFGRYEEPDLYFRRAGLELWLDRQFPPKPRAKASDESPTTSEPPPPVHSAGGRPTDRDRVIAEAERRLKATEPIPAALAAFAKAIRGWLDKQPDAVRDVTEGEVMRVRTIEDHIRPLWTRYREKKNRFPDRFWTVFPLLLFANLNSHPSPMAANHGLIGETTMDLQSEIADLRRRLERLERAPHKSTRGSTSQAGAAAYLGRSREWLRLLNARGEGPRRGPDGRYSYDDLDAFRENVDHESIDNLTPADVYFGRGQTILLERERIKRNTTQTRRLLHRRQAA
jgi:hypothetical protein